MNKILLIIVMSLFVLMTNISATNIELVSTNPSPVVSGDYVDLTLKFTNSIGEEKVNVEVEILENDFIIPIDKIANFQNMFSGEIYTRTFRLYITDKVPRGKYDLEVKFSYDYGNFISKIPLYVEDSNYLPEILIGKIESIPNQLISDTDNNKIKITLQNLGDKRAELLKANLIIDEKYAIPSNSYSFLDTVTSIENGEEKIVEFVLDIEKDVKGEIPSLLELRYRTKKGVGNSTQIYTETIDFSIPIDKSPNLIIEKVEFLSPMKVGTTDNKFRIYIKNIGDEKADDVRIRFIPDISYPFIFDKSSKYLASEIDVGETFSIQFEVEVLKIGEGRDYPTKLRIENLVGESRQEKETIINLKTFENGKLDNFTIGLMIVGFIVITSFGVGYLRKKKTTKSKK